MIVKRIKKAEDQSGNVDVTIMMTPEQANFFMNVGLNLMVSRGAVSLMDYTPEEFEAEVEQLRKEGVAAEVIAATTVTPERNEEADQQFLQDVDVKELHSA